MIFDVGNASSLRSIRIPEQGATRHVQVPIVEYLSLDGPVLTALECTECHARYFDRRNGCASCDGVEFARISLTTEGEVRAFTIVSVAAPGVPVPFVAGIVDCGGTSVRANLVNVDPEPDAVYLGMSVRLVTFPIGTDEQGTEAVGFGFEPLDKVEAA